MAFASIFKAFRVRITDFVDDYGQNSNADASVDQQGNLWTRAYVPSVVSSLAYKAVPADDTAVISAIGLILTQVGGFNDSASAIYVQLFNRTNAIPAATAPDMTFYVPSNSSFSWTPSKNGRIFDLGLVFGVSSTRDTYTALVTPIFLFAEGTYL